MEHHLKNISFLYLVSLYFYGIVFIPFSTLIFSQIYYLSWQPVQWLMPVCPQNYLKMLLAWEPSIKKKKNQSHLDNCKTFIITTLLFRNFPFKNHWLVFWLNLRSIFLFLLLQPSVAKRHCWLLSHWCVSHSIRFIILSTFWLLLFNYFLLKVFICSYQYSRKYIGLADITPGHLDGLLPNFTILCKSPGWDSVSSHTKWS